MMFLSKNTVFFVKTNPFDGENISQYMFLGLINNHYF